MVVFDEFPGAQYAFSYEPAALGDPLRGVVVEMGDEQHAHDIEVSECPVGDGVQGLGRIPLAASGRTQPVKRFGPASGTIDMDTPI